MPLQTQIVYAHGRYRLVPLVTLLSIEVDGRKLGYTFDLSEVDQAVATVDELAAREGSRQHVSE